MDFNDTYIKYLDILIKESEDAGSVNMEHLNDLKKLKTEFARRSEAIRIKNERMKRSAYDLKQREKHSKYVQLLNKISQK